MAVSTRVPGDGRVANRPMLCRRASRAARRQAGRPGPACRALPHGPILSWLAQRIEQLLDRGPYAIKHIRKTRELESAA